MSSHLCTDFYEDDDGFWICHCMCGQDLGAAPDPETVTDMLMQHAYEAGYRDGRN